MTISEFDSRVGTHIVGWPNWLHPLMLGATFVGLPAVVVAVAAIAAVMTWRSNQPKMAWAFAFAVAGLGLNTLIKASVQRLRPDTSFALAMKIKSYSFPSGHAFGSLVVYGLAAYLSAKYLPSPWNMIVAALLAGLIIVIGLSRVYLGAHYPTDVLGGWIFGLLVLALVIILVKP